MSTAAPGDFASMSELKMESTEGSLAPKSAPARVKNRIERLREFGGNLSIQWSQGMRKVVLRQKLAVLTSQSIIPCNRRVLTGQISV
jgi:hypothetical protein